MPNRKDGAQLFSLPPIIHMITWTIFLINCTLSASAAAPAAAVDIPHPQHPEMAGAYTYGH